MATITSRTGARSWGTATDWVGDAIPSAGDSVIIDANCQMWMNYDYSGGAGLLDVTIKSHATTPGELYFKDTASGYLKIQTGYSIKGNNDGVTKGRLFANSDGVWANNGAMAYADKAVIELVTAAKIDALYLDIKLKATHPTNWYVDVFKPCTSGQTYFEVVSVDTGTNTLHVHDSGGNAIDPPADATDIRFTTTGTLPSGLREDEVYFVYARNTTSDTMKVTRVSANAYTIVQLGNSWTGTVKMWIGHTDTATATVNVMQDVSAQTGWTTTDGHDKVTLVDIGPANYDQQRGSLVTINSGSIVMAANVDSAQYSAARLYMCSRNVSVRSSASSNTTPVIDYGAGTHGGVFDCEIASTGGSGTTFYGYGIVGGVGHTISGIMWGFYRATSGAHVTTMSGAIVSCRSGIQGGYASHGSPVTSSVSGTIAGCLYGLDAITGSYLTVEISGLICGCTTAIYGTGCRIVQTAAGLVLGCTDGYSGCYHASETQGSKSSIGGNIHSVGGSAFYANTYTDVEITSTMRGCAACFGVHSVNGYFHYSGTIIGCRYAFSNVSIQAWADVDLSYCEYLTHTVTGTYGNRFRISGSVSNVNYGFYDSYGPIHAHNLTISGAATCAIQNSYVIADGLTLTGNGSDHTYGSNPQVNFEHKHTRATTYGGTANHVRLWHPSGSTITTTTTSGEYPSGKTYGYKLTFGAGSGVLFPLVYMEWRVERLLGGTISIPVWVYNYKSSGSLSAYERITMALVDANNDPWVDPNASYLDSFASANTHNDMNQTWETDTLTYVQTDDRPVVLRMYVGIRASGNSYFYFDPQSGGATIIGGSYGY